MVLVGGLAAILMLGFTLLDSSLAKHKLLNKQLSQVRTEAALAQAQVVELSRQLSQDPDAAARERIRDVGEELADIDDELKEVHRGLVSPEGMARVLEDILTRNRPSLLETLNIAAVSTLTGAEPSAEDRAGVYRHGVELTLEGSYLDLLDYVSRLERLPWQMFWARADMDATAYPRVRLTVVLYTLSLDKKWMVV